MREKRSRVPKDDSLENLADLQEDLRGVKLFRCDDKFPCSKLLEDWQVKEAQNVIKLSNSQRDRCLQISMRLMMMKGFNIRSLWLHDFLIFIFLNRKFGYERKSQRIIFSG